MSSNPNTIKIFLPSGEQPHGIRIGEITACIVQVIEVLRSLLADFLAMEQSSQVGILVLISVDSATAAGSKPARQACPVPADSVISGSREKRRALGSFTQSHCRAVGLRSSS
jgi:hypothetical protein